jgi:hypothetical protein
MSGDAAPQERTTSGRTGAALALGIAAGLTLAGASLAAWVREVRTEDVAGVPIEAVEVTPGVELAPLLLPLGIAAAGLAFALALPVPFVRRALGSVLILIGGLATVLAGRGIVAALALDAGVEAGAFAAVLSSIGVAAAGLLAIRPAAPPPPRLPSRYDLDEDDADAEWDLASAEPDEDEGGASPSSPPGVEGRTSSDPDGVA